MEPALIYELENNIDELKPSIDEDGNEIGSIFPTNAPKGVIKPYLVYTRINTKRLKTLEGYTDKQEISYMFSIMATKYFDMIRIRKKVEELLLSLPGKYIGADNSIFIEDIEINNITEIYEPELKVNRGIIDFTIYY